MNWNEALTEAKQDAKSFGSPMAIVEEEEGFRLLMLGDATRMGFCISARVHPSGLVEDDRS